MLNLDDLEMLIRAKGGVLSNPDNFFCATLEELGLARYSALDGRWHATDAGRDALAAALAAFKREVCR